MARTARISNELSSLKPILFRAVVVSESFDPEPSRGDWNPVAYKTRKAPAKRLAKTKARTMVGAERRDKIIKMWDQLKRGA